MKRMITPSIEVDAEYEPYSAGSEWNHGDWFYFPVLESEKGTPQMLPVIIFRDQER